MHSGKQYSLKEFIIWTRRDIYWIFLLAAIPTALFDFFGFKWLAIPWVPIAMIGTAAAFIVGFRNTQTYNRLWEARQIYGSIVNTSRTWGIMAKDFITNSPASTATEEELHSIRKTLIYRHIAWLTALRFQLREKRAWENMDKPSNKEYQQLYKVLEYETTLETELQKYLSQEELNYIVSKKNRATQIITLQSKHLKELAEKGLLSEFKHVALEDRLKDLFDHQGRCERIKNFPYPRQFASINMFFIRLFVIMLPFGLINEFAKLGEHCVWFTVPFSVIVGWVFNSMERVGESTENPFEGSANDVPITAMSRTIEIDLKDMLDETDLPPAITPINNILM